jgi:cytidylate kinase
MLKERIDDEIDRWIYEFKRKGGLVHASKIAVELLKKRIYVWIDREDDSAWR